MHERYCSRIYNLVLEITGGNTYMAEEVTQVVFLKFWEKTDNLNGAEELRNYLFTIARNTLFNYLKRETLQYIYLNYLQDAPHTDNATQDNLDALFLRTYVSALASEMPPMRRRVFEMSRNECLTNKEISERLDISVSTVEKHIAQALKYIRSELKKRYDI